MKPDWDKLTEEFAASKTGVVADVDCTKDDAKDLCSRMGVKGYPTIKYFTETTAATGDSYEGGRSYADLKKWADENLGPSCSPSSLDLCNDEQTAEIEKYQAMDLSELEEMVESKTKAAEAAEKKFKDEVAKLQKKYEELQTEKEAAVEASNVDMRVMRQVVGAADSA
jgi:hypothetical protein